MTIQNVYRAITRFNQGIIAPGTKHSYIYYVGIRELAKQIDKAIALVRFGDLKV
jgi:ribosomal protein S6